MTAQKNDELKEIFCPNPECAGCIQEDHGSTRQQKQQLENIGHGFWHETVLWCSRCQRTYLITSDDAQTEKLDVHYLEETREN